MKYIVGVLIVAFFLACGNDTESTSESEMPQKKYIITEKSDKDEVTESKIDLSLVSNLNEKLKPLLKEYFLSKTHIRGDSSEVLDLVVLISEECDKFTYSYSVDRENFDVEQYGGETDVLTDRTNIKVSMQILELSKSSITIVIDGDIEYEFQEFSYYGGANTSVDGISFYDEVTFDLIGTNSKLQSLSMIESGRVRKFSRAELKDFTIDELGYLRNEFYARKGYRFKTEKMQVYFAEKSWYEGTADAYPKLTKTELYNIFFIKAMEEELRLSASGDGSKSISSVYELGTKRLLTTKDLQPLNVHQLSYLRNEFYARKGYRFRSKRLNEYFSALAWYSPIYDEDVTDKLSNIERQNIQIIKKLEEEEH